MYRRYFVVEWLLVVVMTFGMTGTARAELSLGDMNCDGLINALDVQPFVDCILNNNDCRHPCISIDMVEVGNPGNPGDARYPGDGVPSFGGVNYTYRIGKYEITAGQYAAFLNAVAASDPFGLFGPNTGIPGTSTIQRIGTAGGYSYVCREGAWANRAIREVTWAQAARFCNWLHNGQPKGLQGLATTEDGAYFLNGATTESVLASVTRKPGARWAVPTEDEWYKAAYHKNDGVTDHYWDYPTRTNELPDSGHPNGDSGNSANVSNAVGPPYFLLEPGYFGLSIGPYGTFEQGGNLWELCERNGFGELRWIRGGAFDFEIDYLHAFSRGEWSSTDFDASIGFRVVQIP